MGITAWGWKDKKIYCKTVTVENINSGNRFDLIELLFSSQYFCSLSINLFSLQQKFGD